MPSGTYKRNKKDIERLKKHFKSKIGVIIKK